jgi:hypothetical protein
MSSLVMDTVWSHCLRAALCVAHIGHCDINVRHSLQCRIYCTGRQEGMQKRPHLRCKNTWSIRNINRSNGARDRDGVVYGLAVIHCCRERTVDL